MLDVLLEKELKQEAGAPKGD